MGAWGSGVFDDDAAADWAFGLARGAYEYIRSTLSIAVEAGDFLDADEVPMPWLSRGRGATRRGGRCRIGLLGAG